MDYMHLQNGSDIRGVALEGVAGEAVTLTETAVVHIAQGFAAWLRRDKGPGPLRLRGLQKRDRTPRLGQKVKNLPSPPFPPSWPRGGLPSSVPSPGPSRQAGERGKEEVSAAGSRAGLQEEQWGPWTFRVPIAL